MFGAAQPAAPRVLVPKADGAQQDVRVVDPYQLASSWQHLFEAQAAAAKARELELLKLLPGLPGGPTNCSVGSGPEWVEPPGRYTGFDLARIRSTVTRANSSNIPTIVRRAYAPVPRPAGDTLVRVCRQLAAMPLAALDVVGEAHGVTGDQTLAVAKLVVAFGEAVDVNWLEKLGPVGSVVLEQAAGHGADLAEATDAWRSKLARIEAAVRLKTLGGEVGTVLERSGILAKVQEMRDESAELRAHDHGSPRDVAAHAIAAALEGRDLRLTAPPPEAIMNVHSQPIPRWTLGLAPTLDLSKIELPSDPVGSDRASQKKLKRSTMRATIRADGGGRSKGRATVMG